MAFTPGNKIGRGRPKGSKNKATERLRKNLIRFLKDEFEEVKLDFAHLSHGQRVRFYTDLLKFGLPQLQSSSVEVEFEKMPEQDLDMLFFKMIEKQKAINNEQRRIPVTANQVREDRILKSPDAGGNDIGGVEGLRIDAGNTIPGPNAGTEAAAVG